MPFTSDAEFMSQNLVSGLVAAGSAWYLSDVPPDAATSIWPNVVAGFALVWAVLTWTFPETYTDPDRHQLLYGLFGGIPLLLASYGLCGTAYSMLSKVYLVAGGIVFVFGLAVFLFHSLRNRNKATGG